MTCSNSPSGDPSRPLHHPPRAPPPRQDNPNILRRMWVAPGVERQDLAQVDAIARWQGNRYLRTARADYLRSVTRDLWNRDTKQGARTSPLADLYHPPTVNPWPEVDEALDLCAALDALPPRQRYIIGQLLAGTPAREIAADLGVHESRVSQLRARAVRSLRQAIKLDQDQNDPRP